MQTQMYRCDKCCSKDSNGVLAAESYRLNQSNFNRYCVEIVGNNPSGPMNHKREEYIICNLCKEAFEADLNALFGPLKANQTAMKEIA